MIDPLCRQYPPPDGPVVLVVMDGIAVGEPTEDNAVFLAKTPVLDEMKLRYLYTELAAHGTAVGMPTDADMGNSEVGHNTLGAGRVFAQGAALVETAIRTSTLGKAPSWQQACQHGAAPLQTLHLIGLLSDGHVHSHVDHIKVLVTDAYEKGVQTIRLHVLLDGRDVPDRSALTYISDMMDFLHTFQEVDYRIASGGGRMAITMDRYQADWAMVERGWAVHVNGQADHYVTDPREAIAAYYRRDAEASDQYLDPFVVTETGKPIGLICDGDAVVVFNFRGDRMIELCQAFESESFTHFDRGHRPDVFFAGMIEYDCDQQIPRHYLVSPPAIDRPLSAYLAATGLRSFAISETQKYGHVTYFWNGNRSGYVDPSLETYLNIQSSQHDFASDPEMKAVDIAKAVVDCVNSGQFEWGRVNFPNGDMVGHTGQLSATIKAVEAVDRAVGTIVEAVLAKKGVVIVLADHGNADEMALYHHGVRSRKTSHTLNPVPCYIADARTPVPYRLTPRPTQGLANVAATLCLLLGYAPPADYEPAFITVYQGENQ